MSKKTNNPGNGIPPPLAGGEARSPIPITTRLAIEIPKPKDWQAFQRNCVLLFKSELNDPNAQEYGRSGQKQGGIDVLGRRDGRDDHFVGIQCRLVTKPLKEAKILADARDAIKLKADLKELIFATTAPDDTGAADAAISVTRTLKEEGHNLTVVVYGWGQLQTLIAPHELAYNAFHPSAVATSAPTNPSATPGTQEFASLLATQLMEQMRGAGLASPPKEATATADEDPALHARIDTYRDLFKDQSQTLLAERGLLALLEKEDLTTKPWAQYRIQTNLGSIEIELGRQEEAAARFETAHSIRPTDPNALANLALARIIQGRFTEAIEAAQAALEGEPRADHAITYVLQAAARSDWQGDPETLIPPDMISLWEADFGLAEFLRRREPPGWAEQCLELARRHPEQPEFKPLRALAVLSLAVDSSAIIPGGQGPVTGEELNSAADHMQKSAEHYLDIGFADIDDLVAHLNNAAVLLRLCERHAESEALLRRGMPRVGDEPQLRRLLALALSVQDRDEEAIAVLKDDDDPENQILKAELLASLGNANEALAGALAVKQRGLPERLKQFRWRLIGIAALRIGDTNNLRAAIRGLRRIDSEDINASLLEIRGARKNVADEEVAKEQLRALAASVPADLAMTPRYFLAAELQNQDLPEEASKLLEGHVDLSRPSPAVSLFLESLAAARRDVAFRTALEAAAPEVRDDPHTLWTVAAHAWNLGDLVASEKALNALLDREPEEPRARLLKIEILIRQDRSSELFSELEEPLEYLDWKRPSDQFRLASLLGHFGFADRAAGLAYRLFLEHRDRSRAWMTLSMLVLDVGRDEGSTPHWYVKQVGPNVAVDLAYDDGTETFFVVEPDPALRKLDPESWEPEHALVRTVTGLRVNDSFVGLDGRKGTIRQLRHKYVARLHFVLEHHESRFPEVAGFKRLTVEVDQPGGLDELIAQLKARKDWIEEEESQYLNGPMPLGMLALRLGMDTIEVGAGLAEHGVKLKVAPGEVFEREAASENVRSNAHRGCVLDLYAFWMAWRLEALDTVQATCGPLHVPQSVLDRLRARREQLELSGSEGHHSASYENGKIAIQEVPAERVTEFRDEVDRAIGWLEANATILPVIVSDDLPASLREHMRLARSDIFDGLVLARQTGGLLVTDDLTTRQVERAMGGNGGAWLHVVFGVALEWDHIDLDQYVRWTANLIEAGQNYLGVSGVLLAHAARLDGAAGGLPGRLFRTLSDLVGGAGAEPISHVQATVSCLTDLWSDPESIAFREPVTGHLLEKLIRERQHDFPIILGTVIAWTRQYSALNEYILSWLRGHFLFDAVLGTKK